MWSRCGVHFVEDCPATGKHRGNGRSGHQRYSPGGHGPFNVSRDHFSIYAGGDNASLNDCGSYLGTIVNGVVIGGDRTIAEIELSPGENEVIVGGQRSPYRFAVVVSFDPSVDLEE